MITKDKKEQLLNNVKYTILANSYISLPSSLTNYNNPYNELKTAVETCIRNTVQMAFEQLINNMYTHEDLEDDLNLSNKN